ncbi:MAG: hypothetical protein AB7E60_02335 [Sphingobium sp.]
MKGSRGVEQVGGASMAATATLFDTVPIAGRKAPNAAIICSSRRPAPVRRHVRGRSAMSQALWEWFRQN